MNQKIQNGNQSQILPPLMKDQQSSIYQSPPSSSDNGFPVLAVAVIGIMATGFLLVSYYVFVTKCCFSWQQLDPLRRFFVVHSRSNRDDPLTAYSSPSWQSRGIDELLIRELPTFQYRKIEGENDKSSLCKCVVCLTEFQDLDLLRLLPNCNHAFHLDCIDLWLQSNANCPLCRTSVSGKTNHYHHPLDRIVAPNSSPQDPQPYMRNYAGGSDDDFVVIELTGEDENAGMLCRREEDRSDSSRYFVQSRNQDSGREFGKLNLNKSRKFHHVSIMGDECLDVREKDSQFWVEQPIRRSFSMDSAADRNAYLSIQEMIRENRGMAGETEVRSNEGSSSSNSSQRARRSIFSFAHGTGRGSRAAVLPLEL